MGKIKKPRPLPAYELKTQAWPKEKIIHEMDSVLSENGTHQDVARRFLELGLQYRRRGGQYVQWTEQLCADYYRHHAAVVHRKDARKKKRRGVDGPDPRQTTIEVEGRPISSLPERRYPLPKEQFSVGGVPCQGTEASVSLGGDVVEVDIRYRGPESKLAHALLQLLTNLNQTST